MHRQLQITGEQFDLTGVTSEVNHSFEFHPQLFQDSDRSVIVNRGNCDDSVQATGALCHRQHRRCRLVTISLAPKFWKKRKPDIDILQALSFYQAAHSYRHLAVLQLAKVQAKAEAFVAIDRPLQNIIASIVECSD